MTRERRIISSNRLIVYARMKYYSEKERDEILHVAKQCWRGKVGYQSVVDSIDYDLEIEEANYFVAKYRNMVVGFAGVMRSQINRDIAEFTWCNVLPTYQNEGIGTQLSYLRFEEARTMGCSNIILTTHLPLHYEKLGFRSLAELDLAYGPAHVMLKEGL